MIAFDPKLSSTPAFIVNQANKTTTLVIDTIRAYIASNPHMFVNRDIETLNTGLSISGMVL